MAIRRSAWLAFAALLLFSVSGWAQFSQRPESDAPGPNYVPEGTRFMIQLDDKLDSNKVNSGKHFKAKLSEDLTTPSGLTIPAGKKIKGHVSQVDRGLHGHMLLSFDEIETQHGWRPLVASVSGVPGEHSVKTNEEGEIENKGHSRRRMVETAAAGTAVGAAAGAAAGGGRGAAIGAGAGAAAGLGAGLLLDRQVRLEKGTQLELRMDRPLQVPAR